MSDTIAVWRNSYNEAKERIAALEAELQAAKSLNEIILAEGLAAQVDLRAELQQATERVSELRLELQRVRQQLADNRLYPALDGPAVPWSIVAPHEAQAKTNHDQTLKELAGRGGLSAGEMVAVLEDRKWRRMPDGEANATIHRIVRERSQPQLAAALKVATEALKNARGHGEPHSARIVEAALIEIAKLTGGPQ